MSVDDRFIDLEKHWKAETSYVKMIWDMENF